MILLPDEQRCIEKSCDGTVLASTVARLYQATNAKEYAHTVTGGLALVRNKNTGEFTFTIVDLKSGVQLWDFSISGDIKYQTEKPFFHSFIGKTCMIGFSFADEDDAMIFHDAFLQREREHARSVSSISNPNTSQASPSLDSGLDRKKSKKETSGFGLFRKNTKTKDKKLDKAMISAPSDFQHVSHVGYSKADGFSVQNIPMEWKIIFQKAGITDEQLQDKKQQKVIKKFMKENAGLVASASIDAVIPAPGPQSNVNQGASQQPAATPPSRGASNTNVLAEKAPPPPPSRTGLPSISDKQSQPAPSIPDRQPPPPPAIPGRTAPPTIPSRNQPAGSGAPPPPPPPDFSNAPAPPPIQITPASKGPAPTAKPIKSQPIDLLSQIRQGTQLKSTADNPIQQEAPKGTGDAIADALRDALQKRINAVTGGSDEEDDDDDW
ncbi:hypothetical protein HDV04_001494 [Boothiomyces sp. JEL0838]|nr:hypothetical protein HDV04_001494 [Boothiomyces sp. JEL0838]